MENYNYKRKMLSYTRDKFDNRGYVVFGTFCGVATDFIINQINSHAGNSEIIPFATIFATVVGFTGYTLFSHKRFCDLDATEYLVDNENKKDVVKELKNMSPEEYQELIKILNNPNALQLLDDIRYLELEDYANSMVADCTNELLTDADSVDASEEILENVTLVKKNK